MRRDQVMTVLADPVARELLHSAIPARVAYIGTDGGPRVVPVAFLWTGSEIVMCTASGAPKVAAIQANPKLALTIDTESQPPHVLLVRGSARVEIVDGVADDYLEASRKLVGEQGMAAFEDQVRSLYDAMARIVLTPEWAKVLDFETRVPDFVQRLAVEKGFGPPS